MPALSEMLLHTLQAGEAMGNNARTLMSVWKALLAVTTLVSTRQDHITANVMMASTW